MLPDGHLVSLLTLERLESRGGGGFSEEACAARSAEFSPSVSFNTQGKHDKISLGYDSIVSHPYCSCWSA